jgi:hypothetical protein
MLPTVMTEKSQRIYLIKLISAADTVQGKMKLNIRFANAKAAPA